MQELNIDTPRQAIRAVLVGQNVKIFNFVNAYECKIGSNTKVGSFVEIQKGAEIGENCKVSSHTFICEGVKIGNGVFIGHSVTFINDRSPRAINHDGSQKTYADWTLEQTVIEDKVGIGSGATIMCGIKIGEGAIVGAGAVVTKNVEPYTVVAGNPAKFIRKVNPGE
jgi:acetyltransferase-like isoleucine patch superfamily enzyme